MLLGFCQLVVQRTMLTFSFSNQCCLSPRTEIPDLWRSSPTTDNTSLPLLLFTATSYPCPSLYISEPIGQPPVAVIAIKYQKISNASPLSVTPDRLKKMTWGSLKERLTTVCHTVPRTPVVKKKNAWHDYISDERSSDQKVFSINSKQLLLLQN